MIVEISEAVEQADRRACNDIRIEVFCEEQKVGREFEFDGLDHVCRHYLARAGSSGVGTARVRPLEDGVAKIERVAVLASWRKQGIGFALMERALADAGQDGYVKQVLNSQCDAATFYENLGFRREGETFLEAGIPHVRMTRTA